jgi:lipopolysaccharide export LptBFGC system permease protein LptF
MSRPGDRLRAFVSDWCCEDTMARFIDPAIADLQQEYALASKHGQWLRGVWILARSYAAFGLLVVRTRIASRWTLGIVATVAFLGYYMLLDMERLGRIDGPLPAGAGAWYPNIALILISTVLMLSRFRRSVPDVAAR